MKDPHYKREARKYEHPIPSREAILEQMSLIGEPVSFKRLAKELKIEEARDRDALQARTRAMVRDGQLVVDRRNVFAIATRMELFAGRISAHPDGFGFLVCDESRDDIFIAPRQMRAVIHGDRVLVRVRGQDRRGRDEGEIVEILERGTKELVGRVYFENRVALFESLNRRINHEILIEKPGKKLREGQIVVARIIEQPSLHGLATVEIVTVLGDHLTPSMEVEIALRNHDVPYEFGDDVLAEVDALPYEVKPQQKRHREDLRHLPFVTIDGEDARDFDDAVYCEKRAGGGYRLYVAIADVSYYVKPGTELDREAYLRGTSVYFPQNVVPMLPEKLSNGLCSLNPAVDRLVMVCEMTISPQGRIGSYQFYEGVIHSAERLTYTQVAEWIADGSFPRHTDSLEALYELAKLLIGTRRQRGALDFESTEVKFSFDGQGRVSRIDPVVRNFAHRLIEECMLCANVCAARFITRQKIPGLFRVHEPPEEEKVAYLAEFLQTFGIELGDGEASDYQRAIEQLKGKQNSQILQISLLRSMQQAVYQPENKGHFGLSFPQYAHFTSPIRRYPDLLVHRLIKSVIHDRRPCKEVRRFAPPLKRAAETHYPYNEETVVQQGEHLSFVERRGDDAVYEVLEWVKCDYLSEHVGDDFSGVISAVTRFGFFVQLDGILIDGLVHVSALAGDYYHFEQGEQYLVGERTGKVFGMGDPVTVQVAGVDVDERKVDLELLTHESVKRARKPKRSKSKKRDGQSAGARTKAESGRGRRRRGGRKK